VETKKITLEPTELQSIIIKGVKGGLFKLRVVSQEDSFVAVAENTENTKMKLKDKYRCKYDEEMFKKLEEAFGNNDKDSLKRLWKKAEP
jgi:hypothetical protein